MTPNPSDQPGGWIVIARVGERSGLRRIFWTGSRPPVVLAAMQHNHTETVRFVRVFRGTPAQAKQLQQRFIQQRFDAHWFFASAAMLGDLGLPEETPPPPIGRHRAPPRISPALPFRSQRAGIHTPMLAGIAR